MRRKISVLLCILLAMTYAIVPNFTARAEDLTVTGVPSQIKVGDTFSVSIAVPKNIGGSVYVEYTKENLKVKSSPGSDVGTGLTSYTAFFNSSEESVTFEAVAAGRATVSVYMVDAEYSDVDPSVALPTIPKVTKTITIANEVASEVPDTKSDDNSLSSLKLSSGTLSPSFKGNVTKYTATVGYDVTKVVVSAKTSSSKATIESVTGNGTVNLNVGENTIQIVVKAENGVKATYTIVVTRKAKDTTVTPEPSESESEPETTTPDVNEVLQYNGEQMYVADEIPEESIPTGFESKLLVVNGQQMQGLSFTKGDLKVLYLNNTNGAGSLYVYDETQQMIYPFIKLTSEKSYVIVLSPDEQTAPAPAGFESCTLSIEGKGIINAYQLKEEVPAGTEDVEDSTSAWNLFGAETFYAAQAKGNEFYLIYCMNDDGEKGWYMYDSVEETFQRYFAATSSVQTGGDVSEDLQSKYAALEKELNTAKMTQYIIIAIAVAVVIILIIVIVVLALRNRSQEEDFFDGYDDEEEYEEENPAEEIIVDTMVEEDVEDDEIEIEFYEMEETHTMVEENAEDDEIEIEFYNMEELIVSETEETEKKVSETPVQKVEPVVEPEIKIERRPRVEDPTSKLSSKKDDDDDLEFIDFE